MIFGSDILLPRYLTSRVKPGIQWYGHVLNADHTTLPKLASSWKSAESDQRDNRSNAGLTCCTTTPNSPAYTPIKPPITSNGASDPEKRTLPLCGTNYCIVCILILHIDTSLIDKQKTHAFFSFSLYFI